MYRVIGKRPGLPHTCENRADEVLGRSVSDTLVGMLVSLLPDGVIIEQCDEEHPQYFETSGKQLVGIDPNNPGEMETTRRARPWPEPTRAELREEIENVKAIARRWVATYYGARR